jgi:hypothetical protein
MKYIAINNINNHNNDKHNLYKLNTYKERITNIEDNDFMQQPVEKLLRRHQSNK